MEKIKSLEEPKAVNFPEKNDNVFEGIELLGNDSLVGVQAKMKYPNIVFKLAARVFLDTPKVLLDSQCPHLW